MVKIWSNLRLNSLIDFAVHHPWPRFNKDSIYWLEAINFFSDLAMTSLSSLEPDKGLATEHLKEVSALSVFCDRSFKLIWSYFFLQIDTRLVEDEAREVLRKLFIELLILRPRLHILQ